MRSIEVVREKQRLDYLFSKGAAFSEDLEIQSHWARYLCILVSGFIERAIRDAYRQYSVKNAAPYVGNYVGGRLKQFQNPKMDKVIQLTQAFSFDWAEALQSTADEESKAAVDSIVALRNAIAHGENSGITFVRIKNYYERALKVVEIIEDQCST